MTTGWQKDAGGYIWAERGAKLVRDGARWVLVTDEPAGRVQIPGKGTFDAAEKYLAAVLAGEKPQGWERMQEDQT